MCVMFVIHDASAFYGSCSTFNCEYGGWQIFIRCPKWAKFGVVAVI